MGVRITQENKASLFSVEASEKASHKATLDLNNIHQNYVSSSQRQKKRLSLY